jgi:hypothetical protein
MMDDTRPFGAARGAKRLLDGLPPVRLPALRRALARLFALLRASTHETHIALPLFALLPLVAIWVATFHFIDAERGAARPRAPRWRAN